MDFIYCKSNGEVVEHESQSVDSIVSTIGNDAAIAAFVLAKLKEKITFVPIAATSNRYLDMLKDAGVSVVDTQADSPGGKTVLIEDGCGRRTILSSSTPAVQHFNIPENAAFLYFDFYEEHHELLASVMQKVSGRKNTQLYFNLSASNIVKKAAVLSGYPRQPDFIQFSCCGTDCNKILAEVGSRLQESILIATYGANGSCISVNGKTYFYSIEQPDERNIMGAGAFFAAHFISSLCEQGDPIHAHHYASHRVSCLCKESSNILLESLSQI